MSTQPPRRKQTGASAKRPVSSPLPEDATALARRITAFFEVPGGRFAFAAQRIGRPAASEEQAWEVRLHADEVFPAASLAKLPIAIELLRRADLRQFSLAERLDTSREPRVGGGGVLDYLDPGVRLTLGDLCTLMIIVSDNTASNFLLDLVGMGEVNETLSRLKLTRTTLARHFMDGAARAARRDNLTSADDMLSLLTLIQGNSLPGARRLYEMLSAQQLSAELAEGWLPTEARLAHKDGALEDAVHDAGILSGPGGACIYCILTEEQTDIPAARVAIGQTLRLLWEAWGLG